MIGVLWNFWKTRDFRRVIEYVCASMQTNPARRNQAGCVLRYRNDYGAKYVEIDEYTSEKRE